MRSAKATAVIGSLLILFFSSMMFLIALPYLSFRNDVDFLLTKQHLLANKLWMGSFYMHITASIAVLLAGCIQFNDHIKTHYIYYHRLAGRAYVFIILCISAPTGLIMAFYANGGFWAKLSFVLIAVSWWLFTWLAYRHIRKGNINQHKKWMYRSYALTLSAISLRLYSLVLPHFMHLNGKQMYILIAWLSWTINLAIAEFVIMRFRTREL